jgi:ribonuclease HII
MNDRAKKCDSNPWSGRILAIGSSIALGASAQNPTGVPRSAPSFDSIGRDQWRWERGAAEVGWTRVAGIDEAGRGPLAGPVVAAAVILPFEWIEQGLPDSLGGLNDSKQLTERRREAFFEALQSNKTVVWAVAQADPGEIDQWNILGATHRAMRRAVDALQPQPDHALVDGLPVKGLGRDHTAVVKGDASSFSIAAASVLAKVTRDRWMGEADAQWPGYGFAKHKGYPTPDHLAALAKLGPCPIHRRSFAPVSQPDLPWNG